jgi:opine dehydrogenase
MQKQQVVIMGGGNGALAFAAYFALRGHTARLWEFPEFRSGLTRVYEKQSIDVTGVLEGEAEVRCYETLGDALDGATILMAVLPAFAHARLALEISPFLREDMILVLNPGRTGGALEVAAILRERGIRIPVAETQSLLFACRRRGEQGIHIGGIKSFLRVGVFPADRTEEVMSRMVNLIPPFRAVPDVLTTSFGNIGAMFHPASAMLNVGLLESGRTYDNYGETMTPGVVAEAFSAQTWLHESYERPIDSLYSMLRSNPAYRGIAGPSGIRIRYITEDVPTGLVPLEAFGRMYGIATPTISSLISLAQVLTETDYRASGRTLERLGIAGLGPDTIRLFLKRGVLS